MSEENKTRYSIEQWRHILDAYVNGRHDDPLLVECRACFLDEDGGWALPEDGFLLAAIDVLGLQEFRGALRPLAKPLQACLEESYSRGNFKHDIEECRERLRYFEEEWTVLDDTTLHVHDMIVVPKNMLYSTN